MHAGDAMVVMIKSVISQGQMSVIWISVIYISVRLDNSDQGEEQGEVPSEDTVNLVLKPMFGFNI